MESKKKERKPHAPRNWPLVKSYGTMLMRYSRSTMYRKHAVYKMKPVIGAPKPVEKKPRFKEVQMKNGKRQVPLKRMPRSLPTETVPRRTRSTKQKAFKDHPRRLRKSITPGTVLIVLAGRHKAKVLMPLRLQVEVAASFLKLVLELNLLWSLSLSLSPFFDLILQEPFFIEYI